GLAMQKGIRIVEWFKCEAGRIYQLFAESDEDSTRRDLIATIKRHRGEITAHELMRASWKHKNATSADATLNDLCKAKFATWVAVPPTKRGGRETRKCVLTQNISHRAKGK